MSPTYQPHEFARRAGITIRALHHYDRLGLLKPSGRTRAGYRLYTDRDLIRLEQIVALKFIGFPLNHIRDLLNRKDADLGSTLRQQRQIIAKKRSQLDQLAEGFQKALRRRRRKLPEPSHESSGRLVHLISRWSCHSEKQSDEESAVRSTITKKDAPPCRC